MFGDSVVVVYPVRVREAVDAEVGEHATRVQQSKTHVASVTLRIPAPVNDDNYVDLELHLNDVLFSPDFAVISSPSSNSSGFEVRRGKVEHCYYQGHVASLGEEKSSVTASTCTHGEMVAVVHLYELDEVWFINPSAEEHAQAKAAALEHGTWLLGPHTITRQRGSALHKLNETVGECGFVPELDKASSSSSFFPRMSPQAPEDASYVVELVLVASRTTYVRWFDYPDDSVTWGLNEHAIMLVNQMDRMYALSGLGIRIMFKALVVWNAGDQICESGSCNAYELVDEFRDWGRLHNSGATAHDAMMLLYGSSFGSFLGLAQAPAELRRANVSEHNMYTLVHDYNVNSADRINENWAITANVMTHELAHNLGMWRHAQDEGCDDNSNYLMWSSVSYSTTVWSSCTIDAIRAQLDSVSSFCLAPDDLRNDDQLDCGYGFYDSDPSLGDSYLRCEPCDSSCADCDGAATHCARCSEDKALLDGQLTCETTCPEGTYRHFDDGNLEPVQSRQAYVCRTCNEALAEFNIYCNDGEYATCNVETGGAPLDCVAGTPPWELPPPEGGGSGGTSASEGGGGGGGDSTGGIVGGVIGGLAAVGLIVGGVWLYKRRKFDRTRRRAMEARGGKTVTVQPSISSHIDQLASQRNPVHHARSMSRGMSVRAAGGSARTLPGTVAIRRVSSVTSQLDQPVIDEEPVIAEASARPLPSVPAAAGPPPLPPGWSQHVDPDSGITYYHHEGTGESVWERPT